MKRVLENAIGLYMEGIRDGNVREAVTKYTGSRYTQHSTGVANGIEGFAEFFEPFIERCPKRDIKIVRSIVDEPYVFLQVFQNINDGEAQWVTNDLFDTDTNGKIVEHWDVISAFEGPAAGLDQVNGSRTIEDRSKTEMNKGIIRDFLCDVMVLGRGDRIPEFVDPVSLGSHRAAAAPCLIESAGTYDEIFRIVGEGNFVAAYSRARRTQHEYARFDIFRLKNRRIEEHWINEEVIPPKREWLNAGKF